jgi:hypothetical protein
MKSRFSIAWRLYFGLVAGIALPVMAQETSGLPRAYTDGAGLGWRSLTLKDFTNVNCQTETWTTTGGLIHCTGTPVGVTRSTQMYTNFEMVVQWRHLKSGGNSGVFVWASAEALSSIKPGQLPPGGIEVQVLDHGYTEQYEKSSGKKADWFTTNGDVFPVGKSKLTPFPPVSPGGERSFPRLNLSKGVEQWNHYYIRCINGEVRLWVNGQEVSGGNHAQPSFGYLCLESEGSPIDFKELRIRELP